MEKNIKDYLHLYLGCEVTDGEHTMELLSVGKYGYVAANEDVKSQGIFDRIKPILRPLSDMTEDERREADIITEGSRLVTHFETMRYLLSKSFDLFGLIEAGLAIDKSKLTTDL